MSTQPSPPLASEPLRAVAAQSAPGRLDGFDAHLVRAAAQARLLGSGRSAVLRSFADYWGMLIAIERDPAQAGRFRELEAIVDEGADMAAGRAAIRELGAIVDAAQAEAQSDAELNRALATWWGQAVLDVDPGRAHHRGCRVGHTPDIRSQVRDRYGKTGKTASHVFVDFPGETSLAPDVAILVSDAGPHGNRYECTDVLAAVEFVSTEGDANDYVTKVAKYGRFGVAAYLIVDPFRAVCTLLEGPQPTGYKAKTEIPFGEPVALRLADGRDVDLDTSEFPVKD
jgi:hypothetical protein